MDPLGLGLLLLSLFLLGSWPVLLDKSTLSGRNPAHVYIDFSSAYFVLSPFAAIVMEGKLFSYEMRHGSVPLTIAAISGGCALMMGNLTLQLAMMLGVPLAVVLPLQGSMCVVLGTSTNYLLQPSRNDPHLLFVGVG